MTPERWQQIQAIFLAALERETGERVAFLDQACADDLTLRQEVESLILMHESSEHLLDKEVGAVAARLLADDKDESLAGKPTAAYESLVTTLSPYRPNESTRVVTGQRIDVYRITGLIGQGGMGSVYTAVRDDDQYHQKVAIKLVKAELTGGGSAQSALQRFRRERQILARLEHPNIARLLDGGTTAEGWPYLVMEYIEGQSLTNYCNEHGLTVAEKLELFRAVCTAVQHAHQNLIIHRDLKPSNILVTKDGTAKLLDFGIAKLLNPELVTDGEFIDPAKTATAMRVMTPDYASPEQARGEAVTTATDVYSLGVVLYELLTGARPHHFSGRSFAEIERAICDTEPERPSLAARQKLSAPKASKQLEGDLDNIILMALRKEPSRRYKSVEHFGEDIRRHLDGLPVIARQDTVRYRAGKFVRRHRWGVAASTLIALLLIGGTAFSNYQARRAERRFEQVRKLANTFLFEFDGKIQNITGTTEARELLVKTALEYLDSLAQEAGSDAELQYELASAYDKVGDVQGNPALNNLGHSDEALASYQKASLLAESLATNAPKNLKYKRLLASLYYKTGQIQQHFGAFAESLAAYQRSVDVIEPLAAQSDVTSQDLSQLMISYRMMGAIEVEYLPAVSTGVRHHRQSMEISKALASVFPSDRAQFDLAGRHIDLAYAQLQQGDPQSARTESEAGIAILEPLALQHPNLSPYRRMIAYGYQHLGMAQGQPLSINLDDRPAALQSFAKILAIAQRFVDADAKDQRALDDLAVGLILMGETEAVDKPARGASTLNRAMAELRKLADAGGDPFRYRLLQAETLIWLADAENRQGDSSSALKHLREAQSVWQTLVAEQPEDFSAKLRDYELQLVMAEVLQSQADFDGAMAALQRALAFAEAKPPTDGVSLWRLADCYRRLGQHHEAFARHIKSSDARRSAWQQARDWYRKSFQQWDEWPRTAVSSSFNTTRREAVAQAVARCESQLQH